MASFQERLLAMSTVKKGAILVLAGAFLFGIDYIEPPAHRQVVMHSIPLWGLGAFGAVLGLIVIAVGLVRRR